MAYSKEKIEDILNAFALTIGISDDLFDAADSEYKALGNWIEKKNTDEGRELRVNIYPQGSFALGTVIKPISDSDDYDLDLVCEIEHGPSFSAKELKCDVVKPWLTSYKKTKTELEEKRRCWHVEYEDAPNFHMDVVPALKAMSDKLNTAIRITDKDLERYPVYIFQNSNPKAYVEWFFGRCRQGRSMRVSAQVEAYGSVNQDNLKENKHKTILQKSVQLLKRHRDIMFYSEAEVKPISIIITTLAGWLYKGETTVLDAIQGFVNGVEDYLKMTMKQGCYSIPNPTCKDEDFAEKWNKNPERKEAFFRWIRQLKKDFNLQNMMNSDRVVFGKEMKRILGANTGAVVFRVMGNNEVMGVKAATLKLDASTGGFSKVGTVVVPPSHHYGKI